MPKILSRSVVPNLTSLGMRYTNSVLPFVARLYTDGACFTQERIGGWAYQLEIDVPHTSIPRIKKATGGEKDTTNNRMELEAVIRGLQATPFDSTVHVVTDSTYVISVYQEGAKIKVNQDLVIKLKELGKTRKLTWEWVKGHSGHKQNEICDKMAENSVRLMRGLT